MEKNPKINEHKMEKITQNEKEYDNRYWGYIQQKEHENHWVSETLEEYPLKKQESKSIVVEVSKAEECMQS